MTDWLTPKQAAELSPLTVREIQDLCRDTDPKSGRTPYGPGLRHFRHESPGGRVRYKIARADLEAWVAANTVGRRIGGAA